MIKSFVGALPAGRASQESGWQGCCRDPRPHQQDPGLRPGLSHAHGHAGGVLRREGGARSAAQLRPRLGPTLPGTRGTGGGWERRGKVPRPPPHLARRGHGLALAPRPPRRGLPARPLRPAAAAGGESTQALTLSLGNGCRKVPAAAISPSSRGVPGALLRPPTAPGEFWGRRWSARGSPPRPRPPAPAHPVGKTSPSAARPYRPSLRGKTPGSGAAPGAQGRGTPEAFVPVTWGQWRLQGLRPGATREFGDRGLSESPPSRGVEIRALASVGAGNQVT